MIFLVDTNDKLQVITDSAATVDVVAAWSDLSGTTVTPGKSLTAISSATTTDIVAVPGASTTRRIKSIYIRNKHATTAVKVTLQLNDNATLYEIHAATLAAGEMLEYEEGIGFFTLAAASTANPTTVKRLASDQSNSTTTLTEVVGLTMATSTGTYVYEYFLITQSAAATTGQRFSVNHDGTVTSFVNWWSWVDVSATASTAVPTQAAAGAAGQVIGAMAARAKTTAGTGTTLSVDTAGADMMILIQGIGVVTVAGSLALWHGSEVAAASTVKAGSSLRLTKTA